MILYQLGGRYSQTNYELALNEKEWKHAKTCLTFFKLYAEDGTEFLIRKQNKKEKKEEKDGNN